MRRVSPPNDIVLIQDDHQQGESHILEWRVALNTSPFKEKLLGLRDYVVLYTGGYKLGPNRLTDDFPNET